MGEETDTSMRSVRIMVAAGQEEMEQSFMLEGLEEYTSYTLVLSVLNDKGESPVVRLQNVLTLPTGEYGDTGYKNISCHNQKMLLNPKFNQICTKFPNLYTFSDSRIPYSSWFPYQNINSQLA